MLIDIFCYCGKKKHYDHSECDKCHSFQSYPVRYLRKRKLQLWWQQPAVSKIMLHSENRRARFCPWCGTPYAKAKEVRDGR